MCEHMALSCLNTRKTIKSYVVCAPCQNALVCLFSLYKDWFWNTGHKSYHVLLLHTGFLLQVSGRKQSCQWELRAVFTSDFHPSHFIRGFSKARSILLGGDKATHCYLLGTYSIKIKVNRAVLYFSDCRIPCGSLFKMRIFKQQLSDAGAVGLGWGQGTWF